MPLEAPWMMYLRWTPWTFAILVIALAIWLWTVDKRMKDDGGEGLFSNIFGDDWW